MLVCERECVRESVRVSQSCRRKVSFLISEVHTQRQRETEREREIHRNREEMREREQERARERDVKKPVHTCTCEHIEIQTDGCPKSPIVSQKSPLHIFKERYILANEPYILLKEPRIHSKYKRSFPTLNERSNAI